MDILPSVSSSRFPRIFGARSFRLLSSTLDIRLIGPSLDLGSGLLLSHRLLSRPGTTLFRPTDLRASHFALRTSYSDFALDPSLSDLEHSDPVNTLSGTLGLTTSELRLLADFVILIATRTTGAEKSRSKGGRVDGRSCRLEGNNVYYPTSVTCCAESL